MATSRIAQVMPKLLFLYNQQLTLYNINTNSMSLRTGALLHGGTYKIICQISSGGFGITYEAEHVMLQKRVAIKEFFVKDFCNRDAATSRVTVGTQSKVALVNKLRHKFMEEAKTLSTFHHPNIVHVSDVFEENGTAYYVMDYIEGHSLAEIVNAKGKLTEVKALKYIRQVADALKYVHAHHRLHLDIKPGNIMIDNTDKAILIDFGASKQYDEANGENTSTLMGITTPGYAPIEQTARTFTTFSAPTDIYALGATLYKLVSGITPPDSSLIVSEGLPPLPTSISATTRNAIEQTMKVRRQDRVQTVEGFLSLLNDETIADPTLKPKPVSKEPLVSTYDYKRNKNNSSCILPVIIGAAFIVGLLLLFFNNNHDTDDTSSNQPAADTISTVDTPDVSTTPPATTSYINGHKYVDLGLSVKWADRNIGASSPADYGDYYAWGETSKKGDYSESTYTYYQQNIGNSIKGTSYDVAHVQWGGSWRMPTKAECEELVNKCNLAWTTQDGHNGCLVIGPNGNTIFLPASGFRYGTSINGKGTYGYYWSSSLENGDMACGIGFDSSTNGESSSYCYNGLSIRPVSK